MIEILEEFVADPFVTSLLFGLAATVVGLWLAASWWAFRDARLRIAGELPPYLAAAWILVSSPVLLPLSLAAYVLVRPQESAADRRTRELLADLDRRHAGPPGCPACGDAVDPDWVRCPACATWLVRRCGRCDRPAPLDAALCPWCAWAPGDARHLEPLRPAEEDDATVVAMATAPVLRSGPARPAGLSMPRPPRAPRRVAEHGGSSAAAGRTRAPGVRRHRGRGAGERAGGPVGS